MFEEVKLRCITRDDLERVYEIEKESFKDPYPLSFINYLYEVNQKTFRVAEKDGKIIGYIIASVEGDIGHIVSIAIHPSERKKDVGRKLMDDVLELLLSASVTTVRLEVRKSNIEAQRFYEILGFKFSYVIDKYYGDEDALIYLKPL
ncbi:MAG: ribosomal protein S18-alanine N-acetyltransferase [Candidatus Bathyarchaeota archaeon]